MAPKKLLLCEVLATIKGLDLKAPGVYLHAGTVEDPTLVELPNDEGTRSLIESGALRVWPGKQVLPAEGLKASDLPGLHRAAEVLPGLIGRYKAEMAKAAEEDRASIQILISEAEADLALVRDALK